MRRSRIPPSRNLTPVLRAALVVLLAAALAGCSEDEPAADPPQRFETVVQDDALLLHRPKQLPRTIRTLKALGVGRVRINATWSQIAPTQDGPRHWGNLDRAVKAVTEGGLRPMVDVGFFAPRWAGGPRSPDPEKFGEFAAALAERYSQVRLWTTWNEPNHPVFLQPQWRDGVPVAAHHYRRMHELAYDAIKGASEYNRVLMGGLTSVGSLGRGSRDAIRPLLFLREMACVDARLRPLERPQCEDFEPLRADGFAMHPYVHKRAPTEPLPHPDSVGIADLGRLSKLLSALDESGRIEGRLDVYVTEFGYETNPPDPLRGVLVGDQAEYLQLALGESLARPDVRMHGQFLLRDLPDDGLYQTGLLQPDGRPKPALFSFPVSFVVRAGTGLGLVRPGRGVRFVCVERRAGPARWVQTGCLDTDVDGVRWCAGHGRQPGRPGACAGTSPARGRCYSLPTRAR